MHDNAEKIKVGGGVGGEEEEEGREVRGEI
jgi:hypothetical protein